MRLTIRHKILLRMVSTMSNSTPTCTLDRDVLNEDTVSEMSDLGLSVFAALCGRSRGAFVLSPPDGRTYGCTSFPEVFSTNAGIDSDMTVGDSANLTSMLGGGNITNSQAVDVVDQYVRAVYSSFGDGAVNPYGENRAPFNTDHRSALNSDQDAMSTASPG